MPEVDFMGISNWNSSADQTKVFDALKQTIGRKIRTLIELECGRIKSIIDLITLNRDEVVTNRSSTIPFG